ncbi:hypothetical protein E3Q11_04128 [Wallemia mellicola]|nr:hypothetical protein E3Q11_04128 [Wallemia mellicola]
MDLNFNCGMRRGVMPKSTKLNPFFNAYQQKQQKQPQKRKGFDIFCNNMPKEFSLNLTQEEVSPGPRIYSCELTIFL